MNLPSSTEAGDKQQMTIMQMLGSTTLLCKELNDQGSHTKHRRGRDGRMSGHQVLQVTGTC
jgi:hypothetical protein